VFTYSERPGTPAAAYANPVPVPVRKERNAVLRDLAARKNAAFRERFVGRTLSAVTLDAHGDALSGNFLRIELARPRIANQLIDVRVGGLTAAGLAEANPLSVLV
jgi:threonylcarbamoyladenosine tRNA methylthiotransferase MtaB